MDYQDEKFKFFKAGNDEDNDFSVTDYHIYITIC